MTMDFMYFTIEGDTIIVAIRFSSCHSKNEIAMLLVQRLIRDAYHVVV
jgi:hypothetical protein